MRHVVVTVLSSLAVSTLIVGCAPPKGYTISEKQANVLKMQEGALDGLYQRYPGAKEQIATSYGYAVMSRDDIMIYFAGFGGGYGVTNETSTGRQTFVKDAHFSLGLGSGLSDTRGVLIFATKKAFNEFTQGSWDFGAQAEVSVASRDKGFEQSAEGTCLNDVKYYQFTDTGYVLAAHLPLYHVTPFTDLNASAGPVAKPAAAVTTK